MKVEKVSILNILKCKLVGHKMSLSILLMPISGLGKKGGKMDGTEPLKKNWTRRDRLEVERT